MKKIIISSSICLIIGVIIGAGSYYLYQKKQNNQLAGGINVNILDGKPGIIKHDNFKNKKEVIEFDTTSTGKGKIKTVIKKDVFCPKIKKNIVSFNANLFYQQKYFYMGYNFDYQRVFFNNIVLNTGINVNHNLMTNEIEGIGAKIGVGYVF